ncbi:uncharacterized protein [Castor canadensis]|uniref:Uncharacterized protein n=1 Tax=Castor canadensis TaxID=51338 RepID=A0AC58LC38_CASCN
MLQPQCLPCPCCHLPPQPTVQLFFLFHLPFLLLLHLLFHLISFIFLLHLLLLLLISASISSFSIIFTYSVTSLAICSSSIIATFISFSSSTISSSPPHPLLLLFVFPSLPSPPSPTPPSSAASPLPPSSPPHPLFLFLLPSSSSSISFPSCLLHLFLLPITSSTPLRPLLVLPPPPPSLNIFSSSTSCSSFVLLLLHLLILSSIDVLTPPHFFLALSFFPLISHHFLSPFFLSAIHTHTHYFCPLSSSPTSSFLFSSSISFFSHLIFLLIFHLHFLHLCHLPLHLLLFPHYPHLHLFLLYHLFSSSSPPPFCAPFSSFSISYSSIPYYCSSSTISSSFNLLLYSYSSSPAPTPPPSHLVFPILYLLCLFLLPIFSSSVPPVLHFFLLLHLL